MSKPVLALDMDNTLTKLSPHFILFLEFELWGHENEPKYTYPGLNIGNIVAEEVETLDNYYYKYYELDKYFPSIPKKLFEEELYPFVFGSYDFWVTIPPMGCIQNAVQVLNQYYDLYIVTHAYRDMEFSKRGKLSWLKNHLPFIRRNQIVFDDKAGDLSKYDIIIDDNPWMLENAKKQGLTTVKVCHGYNEEVKTDREIDLRFSLGWDRMVAMYINDLKKKGV